MQRQIPIYVVLGVFLAVGSACSEDTEAGPPEAVIVSPADGSTVDETTMFVIEVRNFDVVDWLGSWDAVDGQGHLQLWIDDEFVAPPFTQTQIRLEDFEFSLEEIPSLRPLDGEREIEIRLVHSDHEPVEGAINARVRVVVETTE